MPIVVRLSTLPRPVRIGQERPSVEPPHAVADQVDGLVGEGRGDLLTQPPARAAIPGDRRNFGHKDPVPGGAQPFWDAAKIGGQR